jgi:hypothetical protein
MISLKRAFAAAASAFFLIVILLALAAAPLGAAEHRLRLRVIASAPEAQEAARKLTGVELAEGDGPADLIWLADDGSVLTGEGEVAAQGIGAAALQSVADKWSAAAAIEDMAKAAPLTVTISPPAPHHKIGSRITLASEPLPWPNLVVFNLSSAGEVQFLYPLKGDPPGMKPGASYEAALRVSPPAGADHLVLVSAEKPLDALAAALRKATAGGVASLLGSALAGQPYRIGIVALFASKAD